MNRRCNFQKKFCVILYRRRIGVVGKNALTVSRGLGNSYAGTNPGFENPGVNLTGQLIGHIVIGVEMLDEAIATVPDFPQILANEWKHCIVAHHGELEFGSPKKPALAEALALNLADNMDAKLQTMKEILKDKTGTEWLGFNRLFESNLRKTSVQEF